MIDKPQTFEELKAAIRHELRVPLVLFKVAAMMGCLWLALEAAESHAFHLLAF